MHQMTYSEGIIDNSDWHWNKKQNVNKHVRNEVYQVN